MSLRRMVLVFAVALATAVGFELGAATPQMPVSEIRPGMVGIGHTVFEGTRVEEFRVNILGVIENVIGPKRNLILARLEGGPLADTGVIAGMSGSPVYIDGRLIGAVSYALGSFSKEPIAGITPIDEMTSAAAMATPRPAAARVHIEFPLTRENLVAAFRKALSWNQSFAERPDDARLIGVSGVGGLGSRELGTLLRPIATPLVMAGFEPDVASMLAGAFQDQGFIPTGGAAAGTRPGDMPFEGPLKPGDAIGVTFVNGDLLLGGTGTVTHIDGDHVYAFGHPMYNLGPTEFPMTRAYVYTVLPSLFSSIKLSTTSDVIGTLLQDRATTIAGRLGPGPALIPVTLTLEADRGSSRTFQFGVVKDQLFTPLMTYSALANTLLSYERQFGASTFAVTGKAVLKDHGAIAFDNLFSGGESPAMSAATAIIGPLGALVTNDDEAVEIERLDLTMKSFEEPRTATLERVWIDDPRPRAGRTVPLKVLLRTYRGEDLLRSVPIEIPANASGALSIIVSDGQRLGLAEQREARQPQQRTIAQLVRTFNKTRKNNTLYVKLMSSDAGAVVNGELLSSLPPSVLAVLEADRSGGSFNAMYSATIGEWEIATAHAVSGVRTLTLAVSPN
jgi:SpoIVB peptidase S55